jgi:hypothetical protein
LSDLNFRHLLGGAGAVRRREPEGLLQNFELTPRHRIDCNTVEGGGLLRAGHGQSSKFSRDLCGEPFGVVGDEGGRDPPHPVRIFLLDGEISLDLRNEVLGVLGGRSGNRCTGELR